MIQTNQSIEISSTVCPEYANDGQKYALLSFRKFVCFLTLNPISKGILRYFVEQEQALREFQ